MEYSLCQYMFTQGQKVRMRAALESSVSDRSNIWTKDNLILTGTYDATGINAVNKGQIHLKIFPDPVTTSSLINFYLNSPSTLSIVIYDAMGQKIKAENRLSLTTGEQSISLPGEGLTNGIYFLNLIFNETDFITQPFLIN